ncbi:hypothetical protein HMPREF0004_0336 [Achromobacter piechaudii ATCC 43553]|uniref:Uncharacterized protein n=1 Tax=Achromobacter piechaudii ATCC 43553 TaxID=742159 RepID=D4X4D9_9BURK|nr:hypothetical protein HMPREF0004_0336 [Achromobacter piechaudii ATCC 43553]
MGSFARPALLGGVPLWKDRFPDWLFFLSYRAGICMQRAKSKNASELYTENFR